MASVGGRSRRNSTNPTDFLTKILLLIQIFNVCTAEGIGDECTNPEGVQGTCISLRSCAPLFSALQTKPLPQSTLDFLRRAQCGFQGRDPLVCCPPDDQPPSFTTPRPGGGTEGEVTEDVSQHRNLGLLRMDICGPLPPSRIYVGKFTQVTDMPFMALLAYNVEEGSPFRCGGSLINQRYVLTAAHCVTGLQNNLSLVSVRLGEHNLSSPIDCEEEIYCAPSPQDIPVEQVIPHPRYNAALQYDIALIRLSRAADLNDDAVKPICLPTQLSQQTEDLLGTNVQALGWGITKEKQRSTVLMRWFLPVISQPQCSEAFGGDVPISGVSQVCATSLTDEEEACTGDSGGPVTGVVVVRENATSPITVRAIQHGILSREHQNCGSPGKPGVYTRVGHFMKWILDTIEP